MESSQIGSMRYDRDHKAQTRTRIVEAAAADIRTHGAEAMRVGDVMSRAGLTHGGFYAHFPSKEALVAEAIAHAFADRYADFLAHLDRSEPTEALAGFIDTYLSEAHLRVPEAGCPLPALAGEMARMSDSARQRMEAGLDRLVTGISEVLARVGLAEPRLLATSVVNEMVGALLLARAVSDEEEKRRILANSRSALRQRLRLGEPDTQP